MLEVNLLQVLQLDHNATALCMLSINGFVDVCIAALVDWWLLHGRQREMQEISCELSHSDWLTPLNTNAPKAM